MALTKSDFDKYEVNKILARIAAEVDPLSYRSAGFFTALTTERDRYRDTGDKTGTGLFGVLAEVSSMGFWGKGMDTKQPFAPMWKGLQEDQRSFLPEDLESAELDFLAEIVRDIKEEVIRAQIADVLWIRKHGERGGYDFAILAFDSYLASVRLDSLNFPAWERLRRALQIAILLKDPERQKTALGVAKRLADVLVETDEFALWIRIVELLATHSGDKHERNDYAEQIWQRTSEFEQKKDLDFAVRCMESVISLFRKLGNRERAKEAQLDLVETLVKYSERLAGSGDYWIARHWLEQAISHLPEQVGTRQRREELYELLVLYGKKADENMEWNEAKVGPSQDDEEVLKKISETVANELKGKPLAKAFEMLATVTHPINSDKVRAEAEKEQRNSLVALVAVREINHLGKTVGRDGPNSPGRHAADHRFIFAGAVIRPAIIQIMEDHKVQFEDVVKILKTKDFAPQYSRWTFAYGLLAGLKFDLVGVAHVLPPVLENALREMLTTMGINTSRWDKELVSKEKSLGEILDHPAIGKILGTDLLFDLKTLLLKDEGGFNLRNDVSHGLMLDSSFFPVEGGKSNHDLMQVIYLWWLALRLCFVIKKKDPTE